MNRPSLGIRLACILLSLACHFFALRLFTPFLIGEPASVVSDEIVLDLTRLQIVQTLPGPGFGPEIPADRRPVRDGITDLARDTVREIVRQTEEPLGEWLRELVERVEALPASQPDKSPVVREPAGNVVAKPTPPVRIHRRPTKAARTSGKTVARQRRTSPDLRVGEKSLSGNHAAPAAGRGIAANSFGDNRGGQRPVLLSSGGSGSDIALIAGRINAAIRRNLVYPASARRLGRQGRVVVRFRLAADGRIDGSGRMVQGSGCAELDQAVLAALGRVGRIRLPSPLRAPLQMTLPVVFRLR